MSDAYVHTPPKCVCGKPLVAIAGRCSEFYDCECGNRYNRVDALEEEIDRLRAIVDRLPKTADGVPIVPGMMLYDRFGVGHVDVTGFEVRPDGTLQCVYFGDGFDRICSGYYSTREAAEAAKEKMT